jgi:hypothetical protein
MYVYIEQYGNDSPPLYTVGFYAPDGKFHPESDFASADDAAWRVHFLNGGSADRDVGVVATRGTAHHAS